MSILQKKFNQLCISLIDKSFRPMTKGRLRMTLPDGEVRHYGQGGEGMNADITVNDWSFFNKCVLYGAVGFGESYVDGEWDTADLTEVIAWMIHNYDKHPTMNPDPSSRAKVSWLGLINTLRSKLRANSLSGSQRNIMDHYDLGNDFFETFLDTTMTYSSAYFSDGCAGLEDAQLEKYDRLCRKLNLEPSDHLLEIGTGWGGFALHAARNYGCRITTTTISREQFNYATKKIQESGLSDKVDIRLTDYRQLTGKYDKIVSIEMIEAVGHEYLTDYFRKCHELLKEDGLMALQMILFPDKRYDESRRKVDWIQKHIFPGSLLPSNEAIQKAMKKTGTLGIYNYEDITPHYAKTLKIWRERFENNFDKLHQLDLDREFCRKWLYYLSYCEAAFKMRHISVAQAVYTRSNNFKLFDPLEIELNQDDQDMISRLSERGSAENLESR